MSKADQEHTDNGMFLLNQGLFVQILVLMSVKTHLVPTALMEAKKWANWLSSGSWTIGSAKTVDRSVKLYTQFYLQA